MTPIDVAIVGYGPTGATLAGLLGRSGLRVRVIERAADIVAQPRAVGFDHDAMRLFQRIGIADALAPVVEPFRDTVYLGVDGRTIQRVRPVPPPYPLAWAPNYTCDQPGLEAVLRQAIARMPDVEVTLHHEFLDATQDARGVVVTVRDAHGALERLTASYLVACDGASSPVRRRLGVALDSLDYDEPWLVVDVRVEPAHLARLPRTNVQYCEPRRPCTYIVCPGNHRRWEFMLLDGEPCDGAPDEAGVWRLLSRWLAPAQGRLWRAAAYRFHALIADDWRHGRILLAGDSAHQTPPFLGQGMCQGLRDAGNLAWKLARVLREGASPGLLDTYAEERRPHVVETTRIAKELGRLVSQRDADRARERDRSMVSACDGAARTVVRQTLIPGLAGGLIAAGTPLAGQAFPQPVVRAATAATMLLDDLTGPGFRLVIMKPAGTAVLPRLLDRAATAGLRPILVAGDGEPDLDAADIDAADIGAANLAATGVATPTPARTRAEIDRVIERDGVLGRWLAQAGCIGALVRPDHYVFGGFASADDALDLIDDLAGRLCGERLACETPT